MVQKLNELKEREGDLEVSYFINEDGFFLSVGSLFIVHRGWGTPWGDNDDKSLGEKFVGILCGLSSEGEERFRKTG